MPHEQQNRTNKELALGYTATKRPKERLTPGGLEPKALAYFLSGSLEKTQIRKQLLQALG